MDNIQSETKRRAIVNKTITPSRNADSKGKRRIAIKKKRQEKSVSPNDIPANPNVFDEHSYKSPHIMRQLEGVLAVDNRFIDKRNSGGRMMSRQEKEEQIMAKLEKNRKLQNAYKKFHDPDRRIKQMLDAQPISQALMKHPKLQMDKDSIDVTQKSDGRKLSLVSNTAQINYSSPMVNKDKKSKPKFRQNQVRIVEKSINRNPQAQTHQLFNAGTVVSDSTAVTVKQMKFRSDSPFEGSQAHQAYQNYISGERTVKQNGKKQKTHQDFKKYVQDICKNPDDPLKLNQSLIQSDTQKSTSRKQIEIQRHTPKFIQTKPLKSENEKSLFEQKEAYNLVQSPKAPGRSIGEIKQQNEDGYISFQPIKRDNIKVESQKNGSYIKQPSNILNQVKPSPRQDLLTKKRSHQDDNDDQLQDYGQIGHHFRKVTGRDLHSLLKGEEDQLQQKIGSN